MKKPPPRPEEFPKAAEAARRLLIDEADPTLCRFLLLYARIAALPDGRRRGRLRGDITACCGAIDAVVGLIERDLQAISGD